jgi:peptidoglycan/LPS O-acetylase OafA/YrhL
MTAIDPKRTLGSHLQLVPPAIADPVQPRSSTERFEMKPKRWQFIWTLVTALWLGGWAAPMVILWLEGDTEQLSIYFGLWVAVALIPTAVVYVVGLLFGSLLMRANRDLDTARPTRRRTTWLIASIGWAVLVCIFCFVARGPINPFYKFAMPLATAVALLIVILPPTALYAAGLMIDRSRQNANKE